MPATTAEEIHRLWADAFSRRDEQALLDLYEDEAVFLAQPGERLARGKDAIRDVLAAFIAVGGTFELERTDSVEGDGIALVCSKWTLQGGVDPDGNPVELAGVTTDAVRRQPDGTWLFAIDNPWGVEAFASTPTA